MKHYCAVLDESGNYLLTEDDDDYRHYKKDDIICLDGNIYRVTNNIHHEGNQYKVLCRISSIPGVERETELFASLGLERSVVLGTEFVKGDAARITQDLQGTKSES